MPDTHILAGNLAMHTRCKDDAFLHESGQQIGGFDVLRQIEGCHAVGLVLGFGGELREAEVGDGLLDFVRGGAVGGKAVRERTGEDLREGGVQGVDELGRGRGEVGGFFSFVILHYCVNYSLERRSILERDMMFGEDVLGSQFLKLPK